MGAELFLTTCVSDTLFFGCAICCRAVRVLGHKVARKVAHRRRALLPFSQSEPIWRLLPLLSLVGLERSHCNWGHSLSVMWVKPSGQTLLPLYLLSSLLLTSTQVVQFEL